MSFLQPPQQPPQWQAHGYAPPPPPAASSPWWLVKLSLILAVLIIAAAFLARGSWAPGPDSPAHSAGTPESSLLSLSTRGLDALPPDYDAAHHRGATRLKSTREPGFLKQEEAAMEELDELDPSSRAVPNDDWVGADRPTPGMSIGIDDEYACTMGFLARYRDSGDLGALTAGHCMEADSDQLAEWSFDDSGSPQVTLGPWDVMQPLFSDDTTVGELSERFNADGIEPPKPLSGRMDTDYSVISIEDSADPSALIGERYEVVSLAGPGDLHEGMTVCKLGFRTKETCGPVLAWNGSTVRARVYSLQGDSGSPLYIKLGGNKVAALGLLSSSPADEEDRTNDFITDFSLLEPVLKATNLELVSP